MVVLAVVAAALPARAAIVEFPLPTANSQPKGITAGPHGRLWFVEASRNQIGRFTVPAGVGLAPPSGAYAATQRFDLARLVLVGPGVAPVGGGVTVNGVDVTLALVACVVGRVDALDGGNGLVARCPGLSGRCWGPARTPWRRGSTSPTARARPAP
jgi:hypothetical protein